MKRVCFVGQAGLGGSQMRGRDVASRLGVPFFDLHDKHIYSSQWDVLVLVKYWRDEAPKLRAACNLLVHDALDCFTQTKPKAEPVEFWKWCRKQTGADVLVSTSPCVDQQMREAGARTLYAPHHADLRINRDWHNPAGPVVYAGGERFLGDQYGAIRDACKSLRRNFLCRFDRDGWQALEGAALVLSPRFGKEQTPLNCTAKPAVKIANAAAARIPVLCTDDPAITSICSVPTFNVDWEQSIAAALTSAAPDYPWQIDNYCRAIQELVWGEE